MHKVSESDNATPNYMISGKLPYDRSFFDSIESGSLRSARIIVPILVDLLSPKSVTDVGCGTGAWLAVFQEHGISNLIGYDGDYVDRTRLLISRDQFRPMNLGVPFTIHHHSDLVLCLEVAEHLPTKLNRCLVKNLIGIAPFVLFSAAFPGQGGTQHRNEQWPVYWQSLFGEYGYLTLDLIRPLIWQDERIETYYRNNIYLFAAKEVVKQHRRLHEFWEQHSHDQLQIAHVDMIGQAASVRGLIHALPRAIWRAIKNRLQVDPP